MKGKAAVAFGRGLALLGLVGLPGCGESSGPSPVDDPALEIIEISINQSCTSVFDRVKTATQKERDVLVWRIQSECPEAQNVLLCVTPRPGSPPLLCVGDPDTTKLDVPFEIGRETKYVICAMRWPPLGSRFNYDVHLLTGRATQPLACPPDADKDYEIALEVVP